MLYLIIIINFYYYFFYYQISIFFFFFALYKKKIFFLINITKLNLKKKKEVNKTFLKLKAINLFYFYYDSTTYKKKKVNKKYKCYCFTNSKVIMLAIQKYSIFYCQKENFFFLHISFYFYHL